MFAVDHGVELQSGTGNQVAGFHSEIPGDPHRKSEKSSEIEGRGGALTDSAADVGKGIGGVPGPIGSGPNGGAKGGIQPYPNGGAVTPGLVHATPGTGGKLQGLHQVGGWFGAAGGK